VVPGLRRIRASFVLRGIFGGGFGEEEARKGGFSEAGAGCWGLGFVLAERCGVKAVQSEYAQAAESVPRAQSEHENHH